MVKKILLKITIVSILTFLISFCSPAPDIKGTNSTLIDVFKYPVQELTDAISPIIINLNEGEFKILPKAFYTVSAVVVSSESYSSGWTGEIAPVDLALVWGPLADPEIRNMVKFSQRNRWYFYRFPSSFPMNNQFIIENSANTHMIPSSENIKRALKKISIGDKIEIKGFLVKINGDKDGKKYWWNSSFSRKDTGNGSCELLYVSELRVNENIY